MHRHLCLLVFLATSSLFYCSLPAAELKSPNGRIAVTVEAVSSNAMAGTPVFSVTFDNRPVLLTSRLGFDVDGKPFVSNIDLVKESRRQVDATWKPVYGERSTIRDRYNELVSELAQKHAPTNRLTLTFRAYDEGIALAYEIPVQAHPRRVNITREITEFRFAEDCPAWATYTAQGIYTNIPISQIRSGCERPLVVRVTNDLYAAIAEARLVDFSRMKLAPLAGAQHSLVSELSGPVESALPLRTPWRVLMLAESPGRLLEGNDLILNLNDPSPLTNTAWIKPGKVLRDVSLSTRGGKACIDFAARRNLQFVLYDAGWYGPETSESSDARSVSIDPHRYEAPLDLPEVLRYANEHGIGIIMYVNRRALERQREDLFPLYREWGVKGVKFGFVQVGSQQWTRWLHESVKLAAAHQLMVDVHDEYRPTGFSRTYPNFMTQEGVRGDEERQPNWQALTTLFTRFLAGAADNTICYYDARVTNYASHAYQLAKMVCFYSPWQFVYWYDRPLSKTGSPGGNAIGNEPELEFFDHCPTVWDDTKVLRGEIGEYAIIARRAGKDWFVGCMNANQPRSFELPLDFLPTGARYTAHIYSDDPSVPTRTHVKIERKTVDRTTLLRISTTAQGGQAIRLNPSP